MSEVRPWMVVTALDGALLDERTFDPEASRASLRLLAAAGVPIIAVSGWTFAEVRPLAERLGLEGAVVIEEGGGIARRIGSSWRVERCGAETRELRAAVPHIERQTGARVRLYSAMRPDEAAAASGLTGIELRRSLQRQFDEPFLLESGTLRDVQHAAHRLGLRVWNGSRFHHLCGHSGSAHAVRRLRDEIAASAGGPPFVVALGSTRLHADYLKLADVPILVPRAAGKVDPLLRELLPDARIADAGARGWAAAIDEIATHLGAEPRAHMHHRADIPVTDR